MHALGRIGETIRCRLGNRMGNWRSAGLGCRGSFRNWRGLSMVWQGGKHRLPKNRFRTSLAKGRWVSYPFQRKTMLKFRQFNFSIFVASSCFNLLTAWFCLWNESSCDRPEPLQQSFEAFPQRLTCAEDILHTNRPGLLVQQDQISRSVG